MARLYPFYQVYVDGKASRTFKGKAAATAYVRRMKRAGHTVHLLVIKDAAGSRAATAAAARANPVRRRKVARRRNPVRRVNHHLAGAVKLSDRVEAVLYRHAQSRTHAAYKHFFEKGVSLYGLQDGTVLLKSSKRLWNNFEVKDSE
jgi:hypothetical protein